MNKVRLLDILGAGAQIATSSQESTYAQPTVKTPEPMYTTEPAKVKEVTTAQTSAQVDMQAVADHAVRKIPMWGLLSSLISRVIPPGYGTYLSAIVVVIVSVLSMAGIQVPYVEIPQDLSGGTALAGFILYFVRRALG